MELQKIIQKHFNQHLVQNDIPDKIFEIKDNKMTIGTSFSYGVGPISPLSSGFCWICPSTVSTLVKIGRAMMLDRPIILEGRFTILDL